MRGIGATRSSGRSEGSVGVTPTGIELGLKVGGIGQLGISTDYGGGVVVAIFGQKIVWGREGGKIHYNFGVLEVLVEARNCVVVETRKIAGQVVASHVYPDPGCKLPEPPKNPQAEPLPPPEPDGTEKLTTGTAYVFVNGIMDYSWLHQIQGYPSVFLLATSSDRITITGPELRENRTLDLNACFANKEYKTKTELASGVPPQQWYTDGTFGSRTTKSFSRVSGSVSVAGGIRNYYFESYQVTSDQKTPTNFYSSGGTGTRGMILFGEQVNIKTYIKTYNSNANKSPTPGGPQRTEILQVAKVLPVIPPPIILQPPSAGNKPPMPDSCCESLSADMADLKEVFAVKQMLAGKATWPWRNRMPGGEGEEIITDYPNLLRALGQMVDHLGIHPPKLTVKDINNAIAGDQGLSNQFPSATQAFEALMAQIWDANGDIDTLTNFLYRLAWLCVQQSFNLAQLTGSVESIKDMLGGETEPLETELTTPFNIAAGTVPKKTPPNKGFGKKGEKSAGGAIDNRIDANTEISTEALLPEFLKIRNNPIMVDTFSGKQDIFDLLLLIRADLEKIKNK